MKTKAFCAHCGSPLPADAPQGVCPKCMLVGFNATETPSVDLPQTEAPRTGESSGGARFVPPSPAELARLFPQLEVLELLGHGGMGAVYKARQKGLDRLVALKILPAEFGDDESFMERFSREARALARLDHPHIVRVHDFGRAGDLCYFVMEYVDGVNLRQMRQLGTLAPKEALALIPQICEALQFAHDAGVVHRDIKPENILVDRKGRVKIADFGLAKLLGGAAEPMLTASHQAMGTYHYMAPEQLAGAAGVDHRADIYSLGVVFYELLTGNLPVGRFARPSKKVQIDVRLDEVVLRALESEPNARYQQAGQVKTAVESICGLPATQLPVNMRRAFGYEYRSPATLLGFPLVHIATGVNPATMKKRVARGWIAIGDVAIGGLAIGGVSFGAFAIGGVAIGGFTLGGVSLGILAALGGLAVGAVAVGGCAVGILAVGGGAMGIYAYGGAAFGFHGWGGNARDTAAEHFAASWGNSLAPWMVLAGLLCPFVIVTLAVLTAMAAAAKRHSEANRGEAPPPPGKPIAPNRPAPVSSGCAGAMLALAILSVLVLIAGAFLVMRMRASRSAAEQALRAELQAKVSAQKMAEMQFAQAQQQADFGALTWWEMSGAGPTLDEAALRSMNLTDEQAERINAALRAAFQKYLELEAKHTTIETSDLGHRVTRIAAFPAEVAPLENELWSALDATLDVDRQNIARNNLHLKPDKFRSGAVSQLVAPGLFGYADQGAAIETWREGDWYFWKIETRGYRHEDRAPQLPLLYARFWSDPAAPPSAESKETE